MTRILSPCRIYARRCFSLIFLKNLLTNQDYYDSIDYDSSPQGDFKKGESYEKQKIENLMREMNRGKDVQPQNFKDYKDFSSQAPTNDEIVAALRVLQRAGLSDLVRGNNVTDLSLLTGNQGYNNENAVLNMLTGNGSSSLNPQVIQSLLTNQMSIGF